MGKRIEKWNAAREAKQLPPDLQQLRPAGMAEGVPPARPLKRAPKPRVQNNDLLGLGNYRPIAHVREARRRFLDFYAERGTMVECCRLAGLSYAAVQHAIERDEDFAAQFKLAEVQVLEKLEREAMRRAVEGTVVRSRRFWRGELVAEDIKTEYSDNLLMMLLRAKAPERYRDNSLITINQVIKAVEGFNPSEVLGLPAPVGDNVGNNAADSSSF